MNSMINQIHLRNCVHKVSNCCLVNCVGLRRTIFSEKYLKIDVFRSDQAKILEKYRNTKETIKKYVLKQEKDAVESLNLNHIIKLLRLSTDANDLDFLIGLIKRLCKTNMLSQDELRGIVFALVRLIYVNYPIDNALRFYKDEDLKSYINGTYGSLFVFNKLLLEKRFGEVVDLFDLQLPDYTIDKSYSKNMPIHLRQAIPYDQLDCVIEALLNINSRKSFEKLNDLVDYLENKKCILGRTALVKAFILSIQQNESEFALRLVQMTPTKLDLRLNLEIIAYCLLDNLNKAFILSNELLSLTNVKIHNYTGKFFPFTIKSIEDGIARSPLSVEYRKEFEKLSERIEKNAKIAKLDLKNYIEIKEES